jgi:hypothetical protein
MASSSPVQRELHIHPAHWLVGVSGSRTAARPYCRLEDLAAGGNRAWPLRVLLVDRRRDADTDAALASLEQHLCGRSDIQCSRVDCDAVEVKLADGADADCLIVLGRGLQMAGDWSDLADDALARSISRAGDDQRMEVVPAAAARGHLVLNQVQPFVSRRGVSECAGVPARATCLLVGRMSDRVQPVAWVWDGRRSGVFYTSLGKAEDFRQPDFLRLVLNALSWIGLAC